MYLVSPLVRLLAVAALLVLFALRRPSLTSWHFPAVLAAAALPASASVALAAWRLKAGFAGTSRPGLGGMGVVTAGIHESRLIVSQGMLASLVLLALGLTAVLVAHSLSRRDIRRTGPLDEVDDTRAIDVVIAFVPPALGLLAVGLLLFVNRLTLRMLGSVFEDRAANDVAGMGGPIAASLVVALGGGVLVSLWLVGAVVVTTATEPKGRAPRSLVTALWILAAAAGAGLLVNLAGIRAGSPSRAVPAGGPGIAALPAAPPGVPGAGALPGGGGDAPPTPLAPEHEGPTRDEPLRTGGDVVPPKVVHQVAPRYPELARSARLEQVVILEAIIGTDGTVEGVKVLRGHPLLKDAATEALSQWRFEPGRKDGKPVRVYFTLTVNFTLK